MRKILLTSAGLETERIMDAFLGLLAKPAKDCQALFIPTAANSPDAIAVLPACMDDLFRAGIPKDNIVVFDMHKTMSAPAIKQFDVIYVTGGSPQYLLQRINETRFDKAFSAFLDNGGVYLGVSAGSIVAANNLPQNLGYIDCTLGVHTQTGSACGTVCAAETPRINLTDTQAILIVGNKAEIIE